MFPTTSPGAELVQRGVIPLLLALEPLEADGHLRVRCSGELDMATCDQLEHEILGLVERGATAVTLDLHPLGFIDCRGLHTLTSLHVQSVIDGWSFRIAYGEGPVQRLLELTRSAEQFPRAA